MMLNLEKKKKIIYKLQKNFETSLSTVVASINGMQSNAINRLRKEARNSGVCVQVAPNSLLRRAILKTPCECLSGIFVGNSIVAFSSKKPSDAAYIFVQFSKDYENFQIKGAAFEYKLIQSDQVNILANLPEYKESLMRLVSILKINNIGKLINILKILSNREVKL